MGKLLKVQKLTTFAESCIVIIGIAAILTAVYIFAPGLRVNGSKAVKSLDLNNDKIDNVTKSEMLPLPSNERSTVVADKTLHRIAEYAWNGNSGMLAAIGGPKTTKGSLMEKDGINLEIVPLDGVGDLRNMLTSFVSEFNSGKANPDGEKTAFAVSVMGDGAPFLISTTNNSLDEKFGKGKYHAQVFGAYGLSAGEDKLIGPKIWRDNPRSMIGAVISSVIGDGDWVVATNFASANKLKINRDPGTYDADAVNFVPSKDDNYINSVKELIASQKGNYTVTLKEVKDGKLTGKTVERKIDGATTWTPGDKIAFDALSGFTDVVSTKDFPNQMATVLVGIQEWAEANKANSEIVSNILKETYIAGNQIKLYDEWAVKASEAVSKAYNLQTPKYWYDMFKGISGSKDGVDYHIGGSKVFNYADALQYFGITDGTNRYKSVYDQVSGYLVDLNPSDFNSVCKNGVVSYDKAVNLFFLKNINDIVAGKTEKVDYSDEKTVVLATGNWHINFATGSNKINVGTSNKDLTSIYNLLIQAEQTKLKIIGYTDNVGDANKNVELSKGRANAVVAFLTNLGIPSDRFQVVDGVGDAQPVGDNTTNDGRAKNRRVEITLLQ